MFGVIEGRVPGGALALSPEISACNVVAGRRGGLTTDPGRPMDLRGLTLRLSSDGRWENIDCGWTEQDRDPPDGERNFTL